MPVQIGPEKNREKVILTHETMFQIKTITDISGNHSKKIARIINKNSKDIKVEPNFKDALLAKGRLVNEFFEHKEIDAFVYHEKDFQKWKLEENGNLVDKVGLLPFKDKVFNDLGNVGEPCLITTSGETLTVNSKNDEVILAKTKKSTRASRSRSMTRSGARRQNENDSNGDPNGDPNLWIAGPTDVHGWFRIMHSATGKFLTSSSSDSATIEDLVNLETSKTKPKKHLVQVKKTFVWCPDIEAYVSFIADSRGYEDVDLKIEFGLDAGQNFLKLMMTVQEDKPPELGVGEFCPPPKKKSKISPSDYSDSGVNKLHIVGIIKDIPETYSNIKVMLEDFGILNLAWFLGDLKIVRLVFGMQPCSATYGCPWCHATAPYDKCFLRGLIFHYKLRTLKTLRDNATAFKALEETSKTLEDAKKQAPSTKSVIAMPMVSGNDLTELLDIAPCGELHIVLGIGNKHWKCLKKGHS